MDRLSSRKYVDMIRKASGGKYGNWDPPKIVKIGDWGKLDKQTGKFIKEGNIFQDAECIRNLQPDTSDTLVQIGNKEDVLRIATGTQTEHRGDLITKLDTTGEVGFRVQGEWKFTSKNRAAILAMTDHSSHYLEEGLVFPRLRNIQKLHDKAIVTEVFYCPAYAFLLTEKGQGGRASLSLHTGLSEVGSTLGAGASVGWRHSSESGVWRAACGYGPTLDENKVYTPLYTLKKVPVRTGWFGRPRGASGSDSMLEGVLSIDYSPPWEELDEDGEEILKESPTSPDPDF